MAIRLVRYLWSGDNAKQDGGRKKFFALVQSIYKYHSRRGSPSFKNLTRTSHFSSERRGIRIFRENSGRAFSETRDRAYVCSTLVLVEIEFKTWRSLSRLYHLRNPLTSNVVFRSTVTRRRNAYIYKSTDRDRGSVASMRVERYFLLPWIRRLCFIYRFYLQKWNWYNSISKRDRGSSGFWISNYEVETRSRIQAPSLCFLMYFIFFNVERYDNRAKIGQRSTTIVLRGYRRYRRTLLEDTHSIIINNIQPVNHARSHGLQYEIRSINATTSDRFLRGCVSRSTAGIMQRTINSYAVLRPLDRQEFQWIRDREPIRSSRVVRGEGGGVPSQGSQRRIFFFSSSSGATALPYRRGSWTKTVRNVAYFSSHRGVSISGETSTGSNIASLPTPPRRPTSSPPPISACLFLEIAKVYENFSWREWWIVCVRVCIEGYIDDPPNERREATRIRSWYVIRCVSASRIRHVCTYERRHGSITRTVLSDFSPTSVGILKRRV